MRRLTLVLTAAVMTAALSLALAAPTFAATISSRSVYWFALTSPNTAVSPSGGMMGSPGDWISVTGAGTFNIAAKTVTAGGRFEHHDATGAIVCQGTWWATGFSSFERFSRGARRRVGGVLSIVVAHYCETMGMTMTDIPMTITSTLDAPPGYLEGTTMADFTQPTGGTVAIWSPHRRSGGA